ncbi:SpoIIE family protein phosphatase [Microbispora sp. ATCC PTA-5024]|uniref:SpoIIE family protein phosphatase n=1 Tax=Microbispora sp. ATCC PTA-5024 TaxID=316330 RepID=UPI0003DC1BC0|nr:SpoIIE family protein phosphatase [Microbispora sp. ATCC PTA-5024]ETK37624.1 histidine kinase [Microbispora sp. ATCC PTA-5024]
MSDAGRSGPRDLIFPGGSEMARRMREFAWEDTPMGDPAQWPASLRTAARICLTSRFPMIVWWGPGLRFLYNDAYLPLLGTKHPALATPGEHVWTEIWHIIGPMLESVTASGEATWSEDLLLPMNRHGYWEETYWTYSYSPLHDDDGTVRGVFTAVSDTTERVIAGRRLAALQDLGAQAGIGRSVEEACHLVAGALERAARDVPYAAVYLRRPDGAGLDLAATSPRGAAALDGWPLEEALANRPVAVDDVMERFGELPAGGWQTPPTQAVVLPLPGETGSAPAGVIVLAAGAGRALDEAYRTFLDLVARQTAALVNGAVAYRAQQRRAEELAELDRAKTAFFSNISHEFRTPLTLIMGPLEELRAQLAAGGGRAREELDVIHRNGLRLGKLVNTLLDFSRIEAGRMQAGFEPVDLSAFTAELAGVFRAAVEKAGLTFEVDCPPLPEPVYVDPGMWEKVVLNLLSNALKFTFEGAIRVEVRPGDGEAVVRVSDTGIGVPGREMPRLFERFHRIENARSRSNEGSGIGLALVRELMALHGGTITADSAEGIGTVFTLRVPYGHGHLPAGSVAPAAGGAAVSATATPFVQEALRWLPGTPGDQEERIGAVSAPFDGGRRARVLVADDNADMREYLRRLLQPHYDVDSVTDGAAALEAVRAAPPDLVVTDVMMPRLDGLQLVAALRGDPRTEGIPVLLLSARAGQEASIEGLEAGADDYLVKPFSAADLLARVRANVELARLRNHHAGWRAALIDSLQEAFFVCDAAGTVLEINAAFADILGYGPEGLPYAPPYPWWPSETDDPEGHRQVGEAYGLLVGRPRGSVMTPVRHRDGRRIWVAATFNQVEDPGSGKRVIVGTLRDVTAERFTAQREAALAALGVRLSRADSLPEALRAAVDELREIWQARRVLAAMWDGAREPLVTSAAAEGVRAEPDPALTTAMEGLRGGTALQPVVTGGPAGLGIALDHPAGPLVLWIEPAPARPLVAEDHTLLAVLAGHLGQALHRIHTFEQQRETALALQRAILGPAELPPGFAVRYEPAARPLEVGGDWYDTVELPDGRIGIVVGDCVGRGLQAATVMGQLRSACRALLLSSGPAQALMTLDRFARMIPGALCATVFCGILDPETGRLTYSSAGHPPGILTRPDGSTQLLDQARSMPLAVRREEDRPEATCLLPATGTLLLYTDGLVERRRRPIDAGIGQAADAARQGLNDSPESLANRIMKGLEPPEGYDDDVALLLYRHPRPLEVTFPADSAQLAPVRTALRRWLDQLGITPRLLGDVLVAAGEACANAIEHGHRDTPGQRVRLVAHATADEIHLAVADTGRWRTPRPRGDDYRGRGLALMRALMAHVSVETGDAGTTITMRTQIHR